MKIILGLAALAIFTSLVAKPINNLEGTKKLCTNAAYEFGNGNYKAAFNSLKSNWLLPEAEIDNMSYQTESQLKMFVPRYGKVIGSEFIKTETIGSSMSQHIYIIKHEGTALRFKCVFYKAKNEWTVNGVFWDDDIKSLFK